MKDKRRTPGEPHLDKHWLILCEPGDIKLSFRVGGNKSKINGPKITKCGRQWSSSTRRRKFAGRHRNENIFMKRSRRRS